MTERQYNVARYDRDWQTGEQKLVIPFKTGVTLAQARARFGHGGNPRGFGTNLVVYRDISDWKLSQEPEIPRLYLYEQNRELFERWNNPEDWYHYDEYSIGEGEPLESWATRLFDVVGPQRAKAVHRVLTRVLHPDNPDTGDDAMWRELNDAYEKRTNPDQQGIRMPDFNLWGQS